MQFYMDTVEYYTHHMTLYISGRQIELSEENSYSNKVQIQWNLRTRDLIVLSLVERLSLSQR